MFTSYLTTWLRELCEWVGFYTGERRNNGKAFKNQWNNLETPECSRDKGKCKYMGD